MTNQLFEEAKPILEHIQSHNYEAYFVGGSVRDYIMGRAIHDIDITTSATPDEIESIFTHTIPVGKEHGTINVVYQHNNYEITTFRAEEDYVDHRRPSEVTFVRDLYEDLQRRDFTMNAIAMDANYQLYDYFDGQQDIKNKVIKTVGPAQERFAEDALRMIRCLRFQSQLSFDIDKQTYQAIQVQYKDIAYLSIERIVIELTKMLAGSHIAQSYQDMQKIGMFSYIPFFKNVKMADIVIDEPLSLEMMLAIIMAQQSVNESLKSLKISKKQINQAQLYLRIIQTLPNITTKQQLAIAVYDYGVEALQTVIQYRELLQHNHLDSGHPLIINSQTITEIAQQLPITHRQQLAVNGGTLLQHLNRKSGPWLKDVLRQIECAIITHRVTNTETEILKWVDKHVKI